MNSVMLSNYSFIELIQYYIHFPFVWFALIVGVLTALCSSLLGVSLVLKRYSFIGDGLSHVAFGGLAVASVLKITNQSLVIMPVTIIAAILLLAGGQNKKMKGDAAIAMLSVSALAVGYLLMSVFTTSSNVSGDVCSTLFGSTSILTLGIEDVVLCVVVSAIVITIFVLFYNRIFAVTFDENFAKATGVKTDRYNLLIAILIAIVIVLGMNLVGSLLISALIIFPALSAMRVASTFKKVIVLSSILSVICAFLGIVISIFASTPVGATIVCINIIAYLIFNIVGKYFIVNR